MSGRLVKKIPLKFLNNTNRYYKTNDDHNAILLQACFDNPIFQEEGNKFQNDDHVVPNDKFNGNDYNYSAKSGRPTEVHFKKTNQRHKQVRIFATVVIAVLLIALIIALLVVFVGKSDEDEPVESKYWKGGRLELLFKTNRISGKIRIIQGPFSVYTSSLKDSKSEAFRYFSHSLLYKINAIFHSSVYKSVYNSTIINSFSSGSVIVHFTITFKSSVDITPSTAESIKSLLITNLDDSVFFIDVNAVNIKPLGPPTITTTVSPGICHSITLQQCINMTDYTLTSFPNFAGHNNQLELTQDLATYIRFFNESCYVYATSFFCSLLSPECKNGRRIPPCRKFCEDVREGCVNRTFPVCDSLPDSTDPDVCAANPYKPAKCFEYKNTTFERCWKMGYEKTAFPNYAGSISEMEASSLVNLVTTIQDATQCYRHASLFACSAFVPKCSGIAIVGRHTIPPCRSLCEATRAGCEVFMDIFSMPWPKELNCSSLPDTNDTSVCIGYMEAHEPKKIDDCPVGNMRCDTDICIPSSWVCDGYQDCADNADEDNCAKCSNGQMMCVPASGQCIDTSSMCDGIGDCYQNVDESECVRLGAEGSDSGKLMVRDGVSNHWQEVCTDNWNSTLSRITCQQLGYLNVTAYDEVTPVPDLKSAIGGFRNGTNAMVIQSYLEKSVGSCKSGKIVRLSCENPVCGTRPAHYPSQLRIVNGESVEPGTWPTQVSLHGGENEAYYCGASLLGHNWVLTAGHCVGGKTTGNGITLKIGASRRKTYSKYLQVRKAKNVFVNPNYSPITVDNDIALIELDRPVYFNDFLRPICLPQPKKVTPVGTRCYAVGWGKRIATATDYERSLREVTLNIVNWDTCNEAIENAPEKSTYKLTGNMICAGGGTDHDACQGDSGGPLLCPKNLKLDTWYIAGVVSWGIGCAIPNVPGVYTEVPLYLEWIKNVTKGEIH